MSRTVLITGASGTVSGALLRTLEASHLRLRALVRNETKAKNLRGKGIEAVIGNLDDPGTLDTAFDGVDDLWLLTAMGPRAPENSMNAMWAARRAGVKRVIRMSAVGAAHDAPTRNGRLHALSDLEVERSGLQWTILRPLFFMQNLLGMAGSIAANGVFYLDMGEGRLGMIDVRDIALFAARLLDDDTSRHHGKIYTLSGPESISFGDAALRLAEAIHKPVHYVSVAHDVARQGMLAAGMSEWMADALVEYGKAYESGWGDFTTPSFDEVVGHPPRGFDEFARGHAPNFTMAGAEVET